ncbi:hypothetical protein [Listeria booriae]|uniref:hypothetical protein n=1 Tax=Listeria booriae TaxID=1552123 RepID=UPI0016236CCE|nr:hypothetical protein [Listeria booriae]MBC2324598.1 hypothetical protein [Listeria booriae]
MKKEIRGLACVVLKWALHAPPNILFLENVFIFNVKQGVDIDYSTGRTTLK